MDLGLRLGFGGSFGVSQVATIGISDISDVRPSPRTVMALPIGGLTGDDLELFNLPANIAAFTGARYLGGGLWSGVDASGVKIPGIEVDNADASYNQLYDSLNPVAQTRTLAAGTWTTSMLSTGTVTLSGGPTDVVTEASPATFVLGVQTDVTFTPAGDVEIFQVESGPNATPPIVTPVGAGAARAADNLSFLTPDMWKPNSWAIGLEIIPSATGQGGAEAFIVYNNDVGTNGGIEAIVIPIIAQARTRVAGVSYPTNKNYTHQQGVKFKTRICGDIDGICLAIDAGSFTVNPAALMPPVLGTSTYLASKIGAQLFTCGILIDSIKIYPSKEAAGWV
jgi:hypothetical protein